MKAPTQAEINRGLYGPKAGAEAGVQKAILELLAAHNIVAGRLNTGAGFAGGRPVWHHSYGKGCADIQAFIQRRVDILYDGALGRHQIEHRAALHQILWIECKAQGGKQSEYQKTFQQYVEDRGHWYLLADSIDVVMAWLKERGVIR